jgi:hypothetical protein
VGEDRYVAHVRVSRPPFEWQTQEPMTRVALDLKLFDLGCHVTDIEDAFEQADGEPPSELDHQ